jgi:hypothetical protein
VQHFATITSHSHLWKVNALHESIVASYSGNFTLHVLVTDASVKTAKSTLPFYNLEYLQSNGTAAAVIQKYKTQHDRLRWSCKSLFLHSLLNTKTASAIIYLDNDICVFNDCTFLFDELKLSPVLLTPHFYPANPGKNQNWLEANYSVGLYNAGFIGVNSNALPMLQWWAECCLYRCEKNKWRGLFDDQKYLDLAPILYPDTKVIQHKGCNVAGWNIELCPRELIDGIVLIDGRYPVIFIHFNDYTIRQIIEGNDPLLKPYWNQYFGLLYKYDAAKKQEYYYREQPSIEKIKLAIWRALTKFSL